MASGPLPASSRGTGFRPGPRRRTTTASLVGGFVTGVLLGLACASTDPVLETHRELEALRAAKGACSGEQRGQCYTGPEATAGRGACRLGQRECQNGMWGPCIGEQTPHPERCNGIDDDCDGIVDNGFEREGGLCHAPNTQGACRSQGHWHCAPDGASSSCDAPRVDPVPEVCDGVDNDCDGSVDEDAIPPSHAACDTGRAGVCGHGTRRCVHATVRCVANVEADVEVCNGLDDDCDGEVDDACVSPDVTPNMTPDA